MFTLDQLLAAQNREFPGSRILSRAEVLDRWVLDPQGPGDVGRTYSDASSSLSVVLLQHEVILFYETAHGNRGARYGIEGSQYYSGFGGY